MDSCGESSSAFLGFLFTMLPASLAPDPRDLVAPVIFAAPDKSPAIGIGIFYNSINAQDQEPLTWNDL